MVDTRQFANEPKTELLGVDGTLQLNAILVRRYKITGVLGVGGMGSVYQARDLQFPEVERYVAVKEMLNLSQNPEMREQSKSNFEREANILASLSHPAIPAIYEYFTIRDRAYLVMEYINGKNLEVILTQIEENLPIDMTLDWAINLCDVLEYLHNKQPPIIFRDIKPANIMIDNMGRLRLIDFGIARIFESGEKVTMIGTEGYSAPEQYGGNATPQSDIYALGATLHHLLTDQDPRLHAPFTFAERPIRDYNDAVPSELEALVMKSLAYKLDQRIKSAAAMKEQLEIARDILRTGGRMPQISASNSSGQAAIGGQTTGMTAAWGEAESTGIEVLWKFKVEEEIRGAPIVKNNTVLVGSYDNNLYALNAKDGEFRWKFATDGGIATTPDYFEESQSVLIGSDDKNMYCVDLRSGLANWKLATEGPVRSSPTVKHGHVFFGSDDGHLYAARMATGRVAWRYKADVPIRSRPAVTEDLIIFGSESGEVYGVDLSGQLKWRFSSKRGVISSPLIYDGIAYFGSYDYHLYAVDITNGWSIWRFRTGRAVLSSPVLVDDMIVFGSADGSIYALDAFSSKERWKFPTENQIVGSPIYSNGYIYFGGVDGYVYCIEPKKGKELWKFETDGPISGTPYISDGWLYIGSTDHTIYAIKA